MEELTRRFLHIVTRDDRHWLFNKGTGEVKRLDVDGATPVLRYSSKETSACEIVAENGDVFEHSDLLKSGIFRATRQATQKEEYCIFDGETSKWLNTVLEEVVRRAVDVKFDDDTRLVTLQVYHFPAGVPPVFAKVWW